MTNQPTMQYFDRPVILRQGRRSARHISGLAISGLVTLFMLMDGIMKLFKPAAVVEGTLRLGYLESQIVGIGIALLVCTLLYVIPRTSILGAILLTGYLGGAVASNVRAVQGWFNVVFPFVFALLVCGGLWLRHDRLRNLVPLISE